jgi:hypothetical protein
LFAGIRVRKVAIFIAVLGIFFFIIIYIESRKFNKLINDKYICRIQTGKREPDLHDFQFTFDLVIVGQLLQLKSELIDLGGLQKVKLQLQRTDNKITFF